LNDNPAPNTAMPTFANVRAIFFDAVGTLIHPEPPAALVYAEVGRSHGSRLTVAEVTQRFAAAFAREEALDVAHDLQTSEERELRRWQRIVGEVLDDVSDPAGCFAELYRHFSLPTAWRCEPDVAALLEELHAHGYRLGIASNYDHRLHAVADGLPALRPLRERVISSEVGWRKPAAEFFAALLARTGLPAERILLVGDDFVNDYEGARACGISAVLLDARGRHADIPERITRLGEVLDLLQR
jgi:putative hydrolase of the HAD superfamily